MAENIELEQPTNISEDISSAETQNTETTEQVTDKTEEIKIPKTRFDEVNERMKAAEAKLAEFAKAQKDAEVQAKAEQGKYQELYEELQKELAQERERNSGLVYDQLRKDIAQRHGYPMLWDRLRGDGEDDLLADLQGLIRDLPGPTAPSTDGGAGSGARKPEPEPITEAARIELANRLNLDPRFIPKNIEFNFEQE